MDLKRKLAIATFPVRDGFMEIFRVRFGLLGMSRKRYLRAIRDSGFFDPAFYRSQRPRCIIAALMPLRHFIRRGEALGLSPCEAFDSSAYLHANPDVRQQGLPPLRHFLEHGRAENRPLRVTRKKPAHHSGRDIPEIPKLDPSPGCRIAVVIHLFFFDLWDEILPCIQNLNLPFDLFVTITRRDGCEHMLEQVRRDRPDARIWLFPNHGRDIFPFVHLLNSGSLSDYRAVCKIHTKKSLHRKDGEAWRRLLISSILPPSGQADLLARKILVNPKIGMVAADGQISNSPKFWGKNRKRSIELLQSIGIDATCHPLRFPLGSIYWVTRPVLRSLRKLDLKPWQFEPEHCQLDGTLAHAIERCLGIIALAAGLRVDPCSQVLNPTSVPLRPTGPNPRGNQRHTDVRP
jgi:Rhamnan synthesis protein F